MDFKEWEVLEKKQGPVPCYLKCEMFPTRNASILIWMEEEKEEEEDEDDDDDGLYSTSVRLVASDL